MYQIYTSSIKSWFSRDTLIAHAIRKNLYCGFVFLTKPAQILTSRSKINVQSANVFRTLNLSRFSYFGNWRKVLIVKLAGKVWLTCLLTYTNLIVADKHKLGQFNYTTYKFLIPPTPTKIHTFYLPFKIGKAGGRKDLSSPKLMVPLS